MSDLYTAAGLDRSSALRTRVTRFNRTYINNSGSLEIPDQIDSPHSGLPAGRDQQNPPEISKNEPYKTHLAYVKERRTPEEAEELLEQALQKLRERRGSISVS